jgi:hypothetical protein
MMPMACVVDTEEAMTQPVGGGNDEPPWYLRIGFVNGIGDIGRRFGVNF